MQTHWRLGLGFSLITAVMWGLLPLALKGILEVMDPVTITWYRFVVSAVLAMLWYGHRSMAALRQLFSRQHRNLMIFATASLITNYLLYLFGLDFIHPSAAQIVIQLAPLLLLLGSVFIFKEDFSPAQWLGVLAFCLGLLLFFHHRLSNVVTTDSHYLLGIGLIIAAAISWAGYGLAQKQLLKFESTNDILLVIYIAGSIGYLPFAQPSLIFDLDGVQLSLLSFAALNTIISYGCFGLAMTYWEASRVSATITMTPLLTLLFIALLNLWYPHYIETETLDLLSWLGGILVVAGSIVAALAKRRKKSHQQASQP